MSPVHKHIPDEILTPVPTYVFGVRALPLTPPLLISVPRRNRSRRVPSSRSWRNQSSSLPGHSTRRRQIRSHPDQVPIDRRAEAGGWTKTVRLPFYTADSRLDFCAECLDSFIKETLGRTAEDSILPLGFTVRLLARSALMTVLLPMRSEQD